MFEEFSTDQKRRLFCFLINTNLINAPHHLQHHQSTIDTAITTITIPGTTTSVVPIPPLPKTPPQISSPAGRLHPFPFCTVSILGSISSALYLLFFVFSRFSPPRPPGLRRRWGAGGGGLVFWVRSRRSTKSRRNRGHRSVTRSGLSSSTAAAPKGETFFSDSPRACVEMLGTSMQFGCGEDRFFPARRRRGQGHHQHRNLQRSQCGGAKGAASGGSASPVAPATTGIFAVLDDREPENSKPAEVLASPRLAAGSGRSSNLDQFLESTTPTVPAQYLPKTTVRGWRTCDVEYRPYFVLGDLWESFKEWSAYGAGVPLVMNDTDCVMQYYVPYLSGIQLYGEPTRETANLRRPGEESDSDCSRDSSCDGSSDCELERGLKYSWEWNHHHHVSVSTLGMDRLSLREKHVDSQEGSSSDDREADNSQGLLLFEFLERDLPYSREPLADKISDLASRFPRLKTLRSCDLLPSSWFSVAWYPIYRIPTGPTLRDLDASFLTFHSLSTPIIESHVGAGSVCGPAINYPSGPDGVPKISLPTFGLASYKLRGSMWTSNGGSGRQLVNSLLQAADTWLRRLHVAHPDYQFFASHGSYRR